MTTCWEVLGIQATTDIEVIKAARRALIKKWHPDTVGNPQKKLEFTNRCAEINAAHDEAVKLAAGPQWPGSFPGAPGAPDAAGNAYSFSYRFGSRGSLGCSSYVWLLVIGGLFFGVRSTVVFLTGFAVTGVLDLFLNFLILRPRFPDQKLRWLFMLAANILIMRFGLSDVAYAVFGATHGPVFNLAVVLAIPIWIVLKAWNVRAGKRSMG